jgi:hypothetical protein
MIAGEDTGGGDKKCALYTSTLHAGQRVCVVPGVGHIQVNRITSHHCAQRRRIGDITQVQAHSQPLQRINL